MPVRCCIAEQSQAYCSADDEKKGPTESSDCHGLKTPVAAGFYCARTSLAACSAPSSHSQHVGLTCRMSRAERVPVQRTPGVGSIRMLGGKVQTGYISNDVGRIKSGTATRDTHLLIRPPELALISL
jgi:hypothetical protein